MVEVPADRMVVYAEGMNGDRGSASLSSSARRIPRLIHASWRQRVPLEERREEHQHRVYHVCLVESGNGSMILNGEVVPTVAGSLILVSPEEPHCFLVGPGEKSIYSEATFEVFGSRGRSVCLPFSRLLEEWTGRRLKDWKAGSVIAPVFQKTLEKRIQRVVGGCVETAERRSFGVNRALLDLLETVAEVLEGDPPEPEDPLREAADWIERNLDQVVSVADLAAEVGLSTNHFIRAFQARYGKTPLTYHQDQRIQAAKRLLDQTHYPIKQIAAWTGFSDVYYFTRLFSARVGIPPGAFRKRCRKKEMP